LFFPFVALKYQIESLTSKENNMTTWKFEIEMKVSDNWIADGFDASQRVEAIKESIQNLLPLAYEGEVEVKVNITQKPTKTELKKIISGY